MKDVIEKTDHLNMPRKTDSSLEERFNFSLPFFLHGRNTKSKNFVAFITKGGGGGGDKRRLPAPPTVLLTGCAWKLRDD